MGVLKTILKMILGLAGGVLAGLLIAAVGLVCFSDISFTDFLMKLRSTGFAETMMAAGAGILAFAVATMILIPLHEAGHLVCGLLTGYKFVSFRVFNFTFIKIGGRLRVKRYAVEGTGGQCLLTPPDLPLERIPTGWYNFGGVLANIIAVAAVVPLLFIKGNPLLSEVTVIFMIAGAFLILTNGIPMKISGVGNDAYNMILLRKNLLSKRGLVDALRANALIQEGVRPKDMPDEWFDVPVDIDYSDQLQVSLPMMAASRKVDEIEYAEAREMYEDIYSHKKEIIPLYVSEIECELVFLRLVEGDVRGAEELLTPKLRKYIETFSKTMSSKERILCAISLFIDNDRDKALEIYHGLQSRKDTYLLQGEVKSDLDIMKNILSE